MRISARTECENGKRMRAELMRVLDRISKVLVTREMVAQGRVSDYFIHAIQYTDELWGVPRAAMS